MFDFSHLPQNAVVSEYVLNASQSTASVRPYVWNKPPNAKFVFMHLIGGGGGGAGGAAGSAGTSRNGGGGGGSGAISQALFLSLSLPNLLYVYPHGAGSIRNGLGGASNSSGTGGPHIGVSNYPGSGTAQPNALIQYLEAFGGGGGTTTAVGAAGTALTTNATLANHAIYWRSVAGRAGTWAATALPSTTSIGTASPILSGAGGGGVLTGVPTVFNGAGFTSEIPAILPSIDGGLASSAADASSGVRLPFVSVGGCGGGANNNGPGGRGGNGVGYGAGGGGGGAGVTGQGGRGGDGGPAYACIIAW